MIIAIFATLIAFINVVLVFFIMNTIFANLNINVKIIKVCARLNVMFDDIFNNNKNKHELLNIFKKIVNNDNERINFRICEIK